MTCCESDPCLQVRGRRLSQLPLDRPQNSQEPLHQPGSARKSHRRKGTPHPTNRHKHEHILYHSVSALTFFLSFVCALFEVLSCCQTKICLVSFSSHLLISSPFISSNPNLTLSPYLSFPRSCLITSHRIPFLFVPFSFS